MSLTPVRAGIFGHKYVHVGRAEGVYVEDGKTYCRELLLASLPSPGLQYSAGLPVTHAPVLSRFIIPAEADKDRLRGCEG